MIDFEWLQRRLVEILRERIHRGEWTERGMARATGVSQPHLHNVLKGLRLLSDEMADQVMCELNISLSELWMAHAPAGNQGIRLVPLLTPEIGPRCREFPQDKGHYYPLADNLFQGLNEVSAVRCDHDPEMAPVFCRGDILLLDRGVQALDSPSAADSYVVHAQGAFLVRYVRRGGRRLYLLSEVTAAEPRHWDEVSLLGREIRDVVQARVVWLSRYMDNLSGPLH